MEAWQQLEFFSIGRPGESELRELRPEGPAAVSSSGPLSATIRMHGPIGELSSGNQMFGLESLFEEEKARYHFPFPAPPLGGVDSKPTASEQEIWLPEGQQQCMECPTEEQMQMR